MKQHISRDNMLIIADPSARLASACREGEDLKSFATGRNRQVRLLMRADREKILSEILAAAIVHFAGHSDPDSECGTAGWELSDGGCFDTGDICEAGSGVVMPWLVFSNSCYG